MLAHYQDPQPVAVDYRPNEMRLNAILMTSLHNPDVPLFYEISDGTITAELFRNFVAEAAVAGRIPEGSVLIWDNARVHMEAETMRQIDEILALVGASRANLPKYSPEFNPCELVFAEVKCYLRNHSRPFANLPDRMVEAFESVSYKNLLKYYQHCTSVAYRMSPDQ